MFSEQKQPVNSLKHAVRGSVDLLLVLAASCVTMSTVVCVSDVSAILTLIEML